MRLNKIVVAVGFILSVITPLGALAAPPGFCDGYARSAVNQIADRRSHPRECGYANPNDARWHGGFDRHYNWCLGVSRETADGERFARREHLERCRGR